MSARHPHTQVNRAAVPLKHDHRFREGVPFACGAMWDGKGTNFALFSAAH